MTDNINTAILAIMNDVGYVQKERKSGLNYSFAGEAALIQALRPSMLEHGVFVHVLDIKSERASYSTKSGTSMTSTLATGTVRFLHAPSGTFIDVMAIGEGADAGDKSAPKSMTGMLKYALRQTFLIETGDDPDREQPEGSATAIKGDEEKEELPERPFPPDVLKEQLINAARIYKSEIASGKHQPEMKNLPNIRGAVAGNIEKAFTGDADSTEKRHSFLAFVWDKDSLTLLEPHQLLAHKRHLNWTQDSGGDWTPDPMACKEIRMAVEQRMKDLGQEELFAEGGKES